MPVVARWRGWGSPAPANSLVIGVDSPRQVGDSYDMTSDTYTVSTTSIPTIDKALRTLTKKAAKMGLLPPVWSYGEKYTKNVPLVVDNQESPVRVSRVVVDVTVEVPNELVVDGGKWAVMAALDVTPEGNIIRTYADTTPDQFKTTPGTRCDHCHKKTNRKYLIALSSPEGDIKVVGKSCLKDYLGLSPDSLLNHLDFMASFVELFEDDGDPDEEGFTRGRVVVSAEDVTRMAAKVIATYGYESSSRAWDYGTRSTKDRVINELFTNGDPDLRDAIVTPVNHEDVITWAKGLKGDSDLDWNMKLVAGMDDIGHKHLGIACWMVEAYRRAMEEEAIKVNNPTPAKVDAPTLGKGSTIEGVVTKIDAETNYFNGVEVERVKVSIRVDTPKGYWIARGTLPSKLYDAEVGDRVRFNVSACSNPSWASTTHLGTFTRPTKPEYVERVAREEEED
jgi:hypothetical protein